jgi:hypothetical protein
MSLEQQLEQIPKPLIAIFVITLVVIFYYFYQPPHSVCDTEEETAKKNLIGVIYPRKVKKALIPPKMPQAIRTCEGSRSAGGCFEYFEGLKAVAKQVQAASPECRPQIYSIDIIKKTLIDGIQNMALLAWGPGIPESPAVRFGWFNESELATFCLLRDTYVKSFGESAWSALRSEIYKKYPAGNSAPTENLADENVPKAIEKIQENEIWQRSVFSVRCEALL